MAQQSGSSEDSSMDMMWAIALVVIIAILFWSYSSGTIIKAYFILWKLQLVVIKLFTGRYDQLDLWISANMGNTGNIELGQFTYVASNIGRVTGVVPSTILAFLAWRLYTKSPEEIFKRTMSVGYLAEMQKNLYPQIQPVLGIDLLGTPMTEGPWASAMTAHEFIAHNKLLLDDGSLDRNKSASVFDKQIGRPYEGFNSLRDYEKALMVLFAVKFVFRKVRKDKGRILYNKSEGSPPFDGEFLYQKLVRQFSVSWTAGELDISGLDDIMKQLMSLSNLKQKERVGRFTKTIKGHAYVSTVLSATLELARESGVTATPDFIWLKPTDRTLWYALNQVGRRVAWYEAAGVRAHILAENICGKPLMSTMVSSAVDGLVVGMTEIENKKESYDEYDLKDIL